MLSAAYEQPEQYPDCARVEPRTNMFVMAALVTGHTRETVKVRNMSASGALVEGSTLPHPGTPCLLNRGEIALEAEVVWMKFGKAGLRFAQRADVAQWLPSGRRSQSDVDDAVRQAKAAQAAPDQERRQLDEDPHARLFGLLPRRAPGLRDAPLVLGRLPLQQFHQVGLLHAARVVHAPLLEALL